MYEKVVGAQATRQGYDQSHIGHIPRASRSCVISAGPCSRSRCSRNMRSGYSPKQCSTFFSVVYNFFIHPNVWGDLRRLAGMNRAYARTAPAIHLDGLSSTISCDISYICSRQRVRMVALTRFAGKTSKRCAPLA